MSWKRAWLLLPLLAGCGESSDAPEDPCAGALLPVGAGEAGAAMSFRAQSWPTLLSAAVSVADFDDDGRADIWIAGDPEYGGAGEGRLLLRCDGGFAQLPTSRLLLPGGAPPPDPPRPTTTLPHDMDGDGDLDLVVGYLDGPLHLWRQSTPLRFEVEEIWRGAPGVRPIQHTAVRPLALDGDGRIDLYVGRNYADNVVDDAGPANLVLRQTDTGFVDAAGEFPALAEASRTHEVLHQPRLPGRPGGFLAVINDFGPDAFFRYDPPEGAGSTARFTALAHPTLPGEPHSFGMGGDWFMEGERVYLGVGDIGRVLLHEITADDRVVDTTPLDFNDAELLHVYWGPVLSRDFDHDGALDAIFTAAPVSLDPGTLRGFAELVRPQLQPEVGDAADVRYEVATREYPTFLRGRGNLDYQRLDDEAGPFFDASALTRDPALRRDFASFQLIDIARDGCLDGVAVPYPKPTLTGGVVGYDNGVTLVENDGCEPGRAWIGFELEDPYAVVTVEALGTRRVLGGGLQGGPFATSRRALHLGLGVIGSDVGVDVTVLGADGSERRFEDLRPGQYHPL